jgi:hypothetical protein
MLRERSHWFKRSSKAHADQSKDIRVTLSNHNSEKKK